MKSAWSFFLAIVVLSFAGCATQPTQWVTFPISKGGKGVTLDAWLKEHPLKAGQGTGIEEISRGETASAAIVQIRGRQPLHFHQDHDLTVIVLKGYGTLTVGDRKLELRPGSIVTIPRGTPHSFLSKSPEPAVAYAMFNPAFDNADFVPVPQESLVKTQKK